MNRTMKETNVPWIGKIPKDWQICRFKDIAVSKKEIVGEKAEDCVRLALTLNGVIKRGKDDDKGLQPSDFYSYQILNVGDFIFKMIDLQNVSTSRVGLSPFTGIVSPAYVRFVPNNGINQDFYYFYLMSLYYQKVYNNIAGDGVRSALNARDLGLIACPIPPKEEQIKIVKAIKEKEEKINALIANEEEQIEKLKAYKQALISEVVTKGLNPNVPMKDSGVDWIGKINCNYSLYKLKYLLSEPLLYGANAIGLKNGDFRFIRITDISLDNKLKSNNDNQYLNAIDAEPFILKDGDVLFARSGATCGKSFVYYDNYGPSCFAGYLIRARFKRNLVIPKYVGYFSMSSIYDFWKNQIFIQATIQNISANKYAYLDMVVPSIEEQHKIVTYLDKKVTLLDKVIKCHLNKIEKLKAYRQSMIYEYATGKRKAY